MKKYRSMKSFVAGFAFALAAMLNSPIAQSQPQKSGQDWQEQWKTLVEAAKKEGELVISAPPGAAWRAPLLEFQKEFPEISVRLTPANGREFWPRVNQERSVKQYNWDLRIGGIDPLTYAAKRDGILDPVSAELLLPEVADEANWYGGSNALYVDEEKKYLPAFLMYGLPAGWINRDVVKESQLTSVKGLTDPQWAKKISLQDFRGGAAVVVLALMLRDYGEPFVRSLMQSDRVVVTNNNRQQAEWLARGNYPIAVAVNTDQLKVLRDSGVPMNVEQIKGLDITVSGFGSIQLLKDRPNPNAARLYINWILKKSTQDMIVSAVAANSRRKDAKIGNPDADVSDSPNRYTDSQAEPLLPLQIQAVRLGRELIK